jgi:amino acid adenylation domain-containing protein
VKIRGYRIELGEIESVLAEHTGVSEAIVTSGDEGAEKRLVGYVVPNRETDLGAAELRRYARERLPDYMVPSAFVILEKLPLTANGKLDRRALPAPSTSRPDLDQEYEAPQTLAEEVLTTIWTSVLGIDKIGIHDNFFALGGDSILSIQVVALANRRGVNISLPQLFQHQTIRDLARAAKISEFDSIQTSPIQSCGTEPFSLIAEDDRRKIPDDVEDAYPLAMLQAGMLYHMEMTADLPEYHNINSVHLKAVLDIDVFRRAVQHVVRRHPVLRTSFDLTGYSEPLQLVHRTAELTAGFDDLSRLSYREQEEAIDEFIETESRKRFDLTRPALMRFHIHRRDADTFQFTLAECHAIIDGWSLHSTLAEIFSRYFMLLDEGSLPEEPVPNLKFSDFVYLERRAIESDECRSYWAERLRDCTIMDLPRNSSALDGERPVHRLLKVSLSGELSERLRQFARTALVPIKSVMLAAHVKVMSVLGGQDDVMTGLTCNGRPEEVGGERIRGLFLNLAPLRLKLDACSWAELARAAFDAEREMLPYRRYPLAVLQRGWDRPLFDTSFTFTHFHIIDGLLQSGRVEVLGFKKSERANIKLSVNVNVNLGTGDIELNFGYDSAQLSDDQIEAIHGYFITALTAMADRPDGNHSAACLLSAAEQRLLTDWNNTARSLPLDVCVHQLFEHQVERAAGSIAAVYEDQKVSYSELNKRANQLAHYLRDRGAGPEVIVGVCLDRSIEMVVGMLGVMKAGGAFLPLDPAYPKQRLRFMLQDSRAPVLLTRRSLAGAIPDYTGRTVCIEEDWDAIARECDTNPVTAAGPDNTVYVIYTSGSTGRPKGVMVTHRGLVNCGYAVLEEFGLGPNDRVLQFSAFSFDASVFEFTLALRAGASLCLARRETLLPGPDLIAFLREQAITAAVLPPSALDALPASELPELRVLMTAGEACSEELVARWSAGRRFFNLYGPTESTIWATVAMCEDPDRRPPIGKPIFNTQSYLLDSFLQPAPAGVAGELFIGGAGVARSYIERPELTAERFIPNPFAGEPGARMYTTGDLGRYLPDGDIEFLGRADHQVKIRGFRIELGEIEAALREHSLVRGALVVERPDASGDGRVVAYVAAGKDATPSVSELRKVLREKLPEFMIPSAFVMLEAFPLTPNGKVDRRALPEPGAASAGLQTAYLPPRTELETAIVSVWQEVLHLEKVGINDNFFDLGGHSISMLRVHGRLRETLGRELPITDIFRFPTVAMLSERLSGQVQEIAFDEKRARAESKKEAMRRRKQLRKGVERRQHALADD